MEDKIMEKKNNVTIKSIVAIGIGAAIFFVLGRFASFPIVANTTANLQYGVLAVFGIIFGPLVSMLAGFIGHTLIDLSWGSPWWSWIIASAVFGLIIGLAKKVINIESGKFGVKEIVIFNVIQVVAHGICWVVIATALDVLIYAEPLDKLVMQSLAAWCANAITTAIVGTLLLLAYAKTRTKSGSLQKED